MLRSSKEEKLVFGAPDVYAVYNPSVAAWYSEKSNWTYNGIFTDGEWRLAFIGEGELSFDCEKGICNIAVDFSDKNERSFYFCFDKEEISGFDTIEEAEASYESARADRCRLEGELEDVEFLNLAMTPEVDILLRNYTHTKYRLLPDIAANVINTKLLLGALALPKAEGALSLKVTDGDFGASGSYLLEWGGRDSQVTALPDEKETDATVSAKALARLAFGYDVVNKTTLPYFRDVEITKNQEGFISAFPKKCCGIFEHF